MDELSKCTSELNQRTKVKYESGYFSYNDWINDMKAKCERAKK